MAAFVLSNKAVEDLSEIWSYSREAWSEHQADTYYHMLLDACRDLADGKVAGKAYPEIQLDVSGFRIGQHIVFYREIDEGEIEIIRILHSRMDLRNRMQD
jgi:toxin ParE1/3/4